MIMIDDDNIVFSELETRLLSEYAAYGVAVFDRLDGEEAETLRELLGMDINVDYLFDDDL